MLFRSWNTGEIDWQGRGWDRGLRGIAFFHGEIYIAASDELFVYDQQWELIEQRINLLLENGLSGLALVLLLDQFSRQVWRDQARAFSGDERALALSQLALARGWIEAEPERVRRQFWLMPQLHSENLAVVEASLPLFERYSDPATTAVARRHGDLLRRFGRYPHRNAALGRLSSSAELEALQGRQPKGGAFRCERCQASGPVQYRVQTALTPAWQLVCPQCWPLLRQQDGYRYGGTRKANRRERS